MMAVDGLRREFLVPPEELEGVKNGSFFSGSSDSGSEYFSPGESEVGSTKSSEEEEDDDYIAELARRMAQYMFQDEEKQEKKLWSLPEKMSAPTPATPVIEEKVNKTYEETPIPSIAKNPDFELKSKQTLIDEQIRAVQFYKFELKKQEQSVKPIDQKQRMKQKRRNPSHACNNTQNGSDIKPVFLNKSSTKTVSGGTGVFLPRRTGAPPPETRKKQGCSTVLIPARVVHALKLHFEKTGVPPRFPLEHDGHVVERDNISSQQKRHPPTAPAISHHDLGLPQEWTY